MAEFVAHLPRQYRHLGHVERGPLDPRRQTMLDYAMENLDDERIVPVQEELEDPEIQ